MGFFKKVLPQAVSATATQATPSQPPSGIAGLLTPHLIEILKSQGLARSQQTAPQANVASPRNWMLSNLSLDPFLYAQQGQPPAQDPPPYVQPTTNLLAQLGYVNPQPGTVSPVVANMGGYIGTPYLPGEYMLR
jgi:hypothetical protein